MISEKISLKIFIVFWIIGVLSIRRNALFFPDILRFLPPERIALDIVKELFFIAFSPLLHRLLSQESWPQGQLQGL